MRKIVSPILLLVLSFSLSSVHAQTKPDTVTDADFYYFFNTTENPFPVTTMGGGCNPDTIKICNLNSVPEVGVLSDDTTEIYKDTLFTMADRVYIRRQIARNKKYRWKQGEIKNVNVIDGDKVKHMFDSIGVAEDAWKAYYMKYRIGYNRFSVPVFSCNKQRCIVFRGYDCSAVFGLGNTNVFHKKGDKWVLEKSCSPWIH